MLNPFIFFQMFSMVQWAIELYVALTCPPSMPILRFRWTCEPWVLACVVMQSVPERCVFALLCADTGNTRSPSSASHRWP